MKHLIPFILAVLFVFPAKAAVVFTNTNIPIPLTLDGIYLNPLTGATSATQPADWNTAPWLNPIFGGVFIGNDDLARPIVTGTDQIVNLAANTLIDSSSNFVAGESGSTTHIGAAPNQFQLGVPGYIGFTFQPTIGGSTYYGWLSATFSNTGPGTIHSYAYENTPGVGILAGATSSVPEPSRMMLTLVGVCGLLFRRRRAALGAG